MNKLKEKKR